MNELIKSDLSWNEYFMRMVYLVSSKSKDPRTKIGAVIVKDNNPISLGYNGFPRGVKDLKERYENRPEKLNFIAHGEFNSVINAAKLGISTNNTIIFTNGIPCLNCCKAIINAGIVQVFIHKQWPMMNNAEWKKSAEYSMTMFKESEVSVNVIDKVLDLTSLCDGAIVNV